MVKFETYTNKYNIWALIEASFFWSYVNNLTKDIISKYNLSHNDSHNFEYN